MTGSREFGCQNLRLIGDDAESIPGVSDNDYVGLTVEI